MHPAKIHKSRAPDRPGKYIFKVMSNICEFPVWNLPNVTIPALRILLWLLYFWKVCVILADCMSTFHWTRLLLRYDITLLLSWVAESLLSCNETLQRMWPWNRKHSYILCFQWQVLQLVHGFSGKGKWNSIIYTEWDSSAIKHPFLFWKFRKIRKVLSNLGP